MHEPEELTDLTQFGFPAQAEWDLLKGLGLYYDQDKNGDAMMWMDPQEAGHDVTQYLDEIAHRMAKAVHEACRAGMDYTTARRIVQRAIRQLPQRSVDPKRKAQDLVTRESIQKAIEADEPIRGGNIPCSTHCYVRESVKEAGKSSGEFEWIVFSLDKRRAFHGMAGKPCDLQGSIPMVKGRIAYGAGINQDPRPSLLCIQDQDAEGKQAMMQIAIPLETYERIQQNPNRSTLSVQSDYARAEDLLAVQDNDGWALIDMKQNTMVISDWNNTGFAKMREVNGSRLIQNEKQEHGIRFRGDTLHGRFKEIEIPAGTYQMIRNWEQNQPSQNEQGANSETQEEPA